MGKCPVHAGYFAAAPVIPKLGGKYRLLPPTKHLKLLDIGCGEGKDAVFFARNGYEVSAFDISDAGIEKTKRLADTAGVPIHVFKADILDYRLDTHFDIIFSSGVLNYITYNDKQRGSPPLFAIPATF